MKKRESIAQVMMKIVGEGVFVEMLISIVIVLNNDTQGYLVFGLLFCDSINEAQKV